MNERIKELAEQAGMGVGKPFKQTEDTLYIKSDKVDDAISTSANTHQEQILKFAELIVKECATTAAMFSIENKRIHPDIAPHDMPTASQMVYHSTCQSVASAIKEHFGVE